MLTFWGEKSKFSKPSAQFHKFVYALTNTEQTIAKQKDTYSSAQGEVS